MLPNPTHLTLPSEILVLLGFMVHLLILCYGIKSLHQTWRRFGFVMFCFLFCLFVFSFPSLFNLFYCSVTFSKTCYNLAGRPEKGFNSHGMYTKARLKVFSNTPIPHLPHILYLQCKGSSIHCLQNLMILFFVCVWEACFLGLKLNT